MIKFSKIFVVISWMVASATSLAQETLQRKEGGEVGNHGQPFETAFRRAQLDAMQILRRMDVKYLPRNTPVEIIEWLSQVDENKQNRFQQLAHELFVSKLVFLPVGQSNPTKTCGHTQRVMGATIQISQADCGKLSTREMIEVLVGDAAHHFNKDDAFADFVRIAVVDGYFDNQNNASMALSFRYKGESDGKTIVLMIHENNSFEIGGSSNPQIAKNKLSPLEYSHGSFHSSGDYASFTCTTTNYRDEVIGRRIVPVKGRLSLTKNNDHTLRYQFTYEWSAGECAISERTVNANLTEYPLTEEELAAIALQEHSQLFIETLINKGVDPAKLLLDKPINDQALRFALFFGRQWEQTEFLKFLCELFPNRVPVTDLTMREIFKTFDLAFVQQSLTIPKFSQEILDSEENSKNHETSLGYLIESLDFKAKNDFNMETYISPLIHTLADLGVNFDLPTGPYQSTALNSLMRQWSAKFSPDNDIISFVMDKTSDLTLSKVHKDGLGASDYLISNWILFRDHCKSVVASTPSAQKFYDGKLRQYWSWAEELKRRGASTVRRGCRYYHEQVSCKLVKGAGGALVPRLEVNGADPKDPKAKCG